MRVARPAAVAFGARIVALLAAFAMNVVIAQTLPIADTGTVVLVMTLVTTFATIARFGTDNLALRITAAGTGLMRPLARPMVTTVLIMSVVGAAGFSLVAALVIDPGGQRDGPLIVALGALCVAPAALSVLAASVLRGGGRFGSGTMAELGSMPLLVSGGLLVVSTFGDLTVATAVLIVLLAFGLTAAWSAVAGWRMLAPLPAKPQRLSIFLTSNGRTLVHLCVAALATFFMVWIPVLALGVFGTSEEVALYNAAARLAAFVGLIAAIQVTYLATAFAKLGSAGDTAGITRVAQRSTRLATAVAGALAVVLIAVPERVLGLFGPDYAAAAPVLIVLVVGVLAQVVAGPSIAVMLTCGIEGTASRLTFLALAVGAVVCPPLATRGPEEVAWAAAVLIAMPAVLGSALLRKRGIHTSLTLGER